MKTQNLIGGGCLFLLGLLLVAVGAFAAMSGREAEVWGWFLALGFFCGLSGAFAATEG